MYPPSDEKRRRIDPLVLAVLVILCLATLFLFHGYIIAVAESLIAAIAIALVIFFIMLFLLLIFIVPLYYLLFAKDEVEVHTSYSLDSVKGSEDTEDEKRGRL